MKHPLALALVFAALLVSGLAFSQAPQKEDPNEHRFEVLQKDIADSRARVEQLVNEQQQTRMLLDAMQKYLEAQSHSAKAMAATLDDSEKAGFTYGINPDSRHIMLRGWRDLLGTAQQGVPPPLPAQTPPTPSAVKDAKKPQRRFTRRARDRSMGA